MRFTTIFKKWGIKQQQHYPEGKELSEDDFDEVKFDSDYVMQTFN